LTIVTVRGNMSFTASTLKRLQESLVDLLYPRRCGACGCGLGTGERLFCRGCRDSVTRLTGRCCSICGRQLPDGSGDDHPCGACLKSRPHYDMARAEVRYEGAVMEAIKMYKYRPMRSLKGYLGGYAADCAAKCFKGVDVVAAVPLHKIRLGHRGFNQSLFLAEAAARAAGARLSLSGLARTRHTRPQVGLDHSERARNVRGAFSVVRPDEFMGMDVLLVDDVYTTGETVKECARVLKAAGAGKVLVLTVARAAEGRL